MAEKRRNSARQKRHLRVRRKISGSTGRPRLNVYRSLAGIYAQLIDDGAGHTLVSASSNDGELRNKMKGKNKTEQARLVGEAVAQRAQAKGIKQVVLDRGGFRYAGRVKALAEGARKEGLEF
uniref:Large ribosomal subunit protein uL18 n=1 Tax=uncultured Chloroflexi bacterium Rifle_16ft_4_minimus_5165 TaxID=1665076 RepID=A0A0H4T968_9CHLR|nr:50S ribosomal protein L18, large subunit ribosomal protein L18 [uncultured Chloroflexi bacterium Rifle_16ft_4_minimus_5165]